MRAKAHDPEPNKPTGDTTVLPVATGFDELRRKVGFVLAPLLFVLVGLCVVCVVRRSPRRTEGTRTRVLGTALLASLASFGLTTLLCVAVWQRVPMQYYVVAAWGWPRLSRAAS